MNKERRLLYILLAPFIQDARKVRGTNLTLDSWGKGDKLSQIIMLAYDIIKIYREQNIIFLFWGCFITISTVD